MKSFNKSFKQNTFFLFLVMFLSHFSKNNEIVQPLPKIINGYRLVEELSSGDLKKYHRLGIYQNKKGKKAIMKWWTGNKKPFSFYSLVHEAQMYTLIQKVHERIEKTLPKELQNISTPKVVFTKIADKQVAIMSEYREGVLLSEKNYNEQKNIYLLSCNYLKTISDNLTDIEKNELPKRNVIDYLFLYPAILLFSLKRQPTLAFTLLRGIPTVLFAFSHIRNSSFSLVHRDLHTKNIIVSKTKQISIIDLQRIVLTFPLYEIVTTLAVEWKNVPFRNALLKWVATQPQTKNTFKGLLINFATHALTANNLPQRYIDKYKTMLDYSVNKI